MTDADHMSRAIRLAMNGRGRVEPNPMVGCVIVKNDRVIGEGYHQHFGGPHAEPNALAACTESPNGATAYVTLEPCCHTNKKTPPCVPKLIEAGLARVVLGATDPNPHVNGQGIAKLRAAGIEVTTGVLEAECRQLIAPFTARVRGFQQPYVTLKWAQTADGKIAGPGGSRLRITNDASNRAVHRLRAASDAILVGVNTVLADDPLLTVRGVEAARNPIRIVLDSDLRIPLDSHLVRTARDVPLWIFGSDRAYRSDRARDLRSAGANVEWLDASSDSPGQSFLALDDLISQLSRFPDPITHLMIESGRTLAQQLIQRDLVDRLWVFESPALTPGAGYFSAAHIPSTFIPVGRLAFDGDTLTEYLNPNGASFFAPTPSADFVLESDRSNTKIVF